MLKEKNPFLKILISLIFFIIFMILGAVIISFFTYKYETYPYSNFEFDGKKTQLLANVTKNKNLFNKSYELYEISNLGVIEKESSVSYPYHLELMPENKESKVFSINLSKTVVLNSNLNKKESQFLNNALEIDKNGKKQFNDELLLESSKSHKERDYYYTVITDRYKISVKKFNVDAGHKTELYSDIIEVDIPYILVYYFEYDDITKENEYVYEEVKVIK